MPAGQGEPSVPGARAEHAVGQRFHLRRHLERLRLCRLCHQCLCQTHRQLARQRIGPCGFVLDALEQAVHERRPRPKAQGSSITATAAANTCRSVIPNARPRRASSYRSAAPATAMTTLWQKPSTASTKLRSSTGAGHGTTSRPWNMPPSNGWTGSTIGACSNPSETLHQRKPRPTIMLLWKLKPWRRN